MSDSKPVFLSHAAEDALFARRLTDLMSARGIEVFVDSTTTAGEAWPQAFRRDIAKVSALVMLIPSDTARDRNSLWFEAGAARTLGKRVLAVLPPDRHVVDLPNDLADVLVLDADRRALGDIVDILIQAVPSMDHVLAHGAG